MRSRRRGWPVDGDVGQVGDADVEALGVGVGAQADEVVDELGPADPEVVGVGAHAGA
jgi:hypothetical protein